jgi:glycosyltransferase involved in cell wall biosynthesis
VKKKMLFLTDQYPNSRDPERGIFTKSLVNSLKKYMDIVVVSPLPWFPKGLAVGPFERYKKYSGVPWMSAEDGVVSYYPKYTMIPKMGIFQPTFMFLSILSFIIKLHAKEKFDIINGHFVYPNGIVATWLGKILNIPVMISARGCDINLYTNFAFRKRMIISAIASASLIVAVSQQLKRKMIDLSQKKSRIEYIPNGVDSDVFSPRDRDGAKCRAGVNINTKVILYVGRLSDEKGLEILIKASGIMTGISGDFKVLVVGDGDRRQEYERLIQSLGLEEKVVLLGGRPHSDLPNWYALADVLCLPSLREGMPNVVLESLACGRPVVASNVGAVPDLIDGTNGYLVSPGVPGDLAEKLALALSVQWDEGRIRNSVSLYSWDHSASMYRDCLKSVGIL